MTTLRRVGYALVLAVLLCSVAAPARADRDDEHWHERGRGHWRHDHWHGRTYVVPERHYYYSSGPDVYYEPPPVYVAPPPPPGGLSLVFPFHFH